MVYECIEAKKARAFTYPQLKALCVSHLMNLQGGLFTAIVDHKPTDTQFNVPPGLTQVRRPP
jgi:hypothetical protein